MFASGLCGVRGVYLFKVPKFVSGAISFVSGPKRTLVQFPGCSVMDIEMELSTSPKASPKQSIREGKAILAAGISTDKVFYNPVQEFNRDLSCLVLAVFFEKFKIKMDEKTRKKASLPQNVSKPAPQPFSGRILDAMAATGLRTCRYALEVPHVKEVVGNDVDAAACEAIRLNATANGVQDRLTVTNQDARRLMLNAGFDQTWFHAVDLDPFGTAAPFLEGALQCIADGGLLLVTCTDTAILCGNFPEACYARYASTCVRNPAHHEISLRILLNCIAMRAGLIEKHIRPLVSVREGHYIRLFLAVHRGAKEAKENVRKCAYLWNCTVCHSFFFQPMCEPHKTAYNNAAIAFSNMCNVCGTNMRIGGPIWTGQIHEQPFVTDLLVELAKDPKRYGTEKLLLGKLTTIYEELPDTPLYVVFRDIFKVVHCTPIMNKQIVSALRRGGYRTSPSHCEKDSYKTDAPWDVIWDLMRCWVKLNPIASERALHPKTAVILGKNTSFEADFTVLPEVETESRKKKLLRFQTVGPIGPMARPKKETDRNMSPDLENTAETVKKARTDNGV